VGLAVFKTVARPASWSRVGSTPMHLRHEPFELSLHIRSWPTSGKSRCKRASPSSKTLSKRLCSPFLQPAQIHGRVRQHNRNTFADVRQAVTKAPLHAVLGTPAASLRHVHGGETSTAAPSLPGWRARLTPYHQHCRAVTRGTRLLSGIQVRKKLTVDQTA